MAYRPYKDMFCRLMPRAPTKMSPRRQPNILVSGTPGTGKSTLSEAIAVRGEARRYVKATKTTDGFISDSSAS
jgi:predicted ATPase